MGWKNYQKMYKCNGWATSGIHGRPSTIILNAIWHNKNGKTRKKLNVMFASVQELMKFRRK
jgi:hypothetical protein